MASTFRHAVIVGKYQARGIRPVLEEIAHFLVSCGLEVSFDRETAEATGLNADRDFEALTPDERERVPDVLRVWLRYRSEKYFGDHTTPPGGAPRAR